MRKKFLLISTLLVLVISACGGQSATGTVIPLSTETSAPVAPATEAPPTATVTPLAQNPATVTPETPIPTNSADCTNRAAFVADVNFPDNSDIAASSTFTKTWRIRNSGTCVWGPDYLLTHYSEERMAAPASVPLSVTFPDQTADISVDLIAPSTGGKHRGNFVIKSPSGLIMKIDNDSHLWLVINVTGQAASAPSATTASGTGAVPPSATQTGGLPTAACAYTTDAAKVAETINAINAYRSQNGLAAYAVNELLNKAALSHAGDIACNNLFTHKGSDGSTPTTRVAASGYKASFVSENVYGSYPPLTGQGAVDWWKNDLADVRHNQNLLSTTYTEIGVAYTFFNNYGYYVIVFAKQ